MSFDSTGAAKRRVGAIVLSSALVGASLFTGLSAANADPAPDAQSTAFGQGVGEQQVVVPNGVCAVNVTIAGGRGGIAIGEAAPDPDDPENELPGEETGAQGSGARISATLNLQAGDVIDINVGGDGSNGGIGGLNGGGNGSVTGHSGGGGGGFTTLSYDGNLLLLAGGGGGSGGGHQPGFGSGGDAGFGASTQADAVLLDDGSTVYPASDGGGGYDQGSPSSDPNDPAPRNPSGGLAGTAIAGGAGGTNTHSDTSAPLGTLPNMDGFPGVSLAGGNGGIDPQIDGAGGGGAGYFGGGGGASTLSSFVTGSGGGGGSSQIFASDIMSNVEIENNRLVDDEGHAGAAEPAGAEFEWVMCDYSLSIVKNVVGEPVYEDGGIVRYSVTVTNDGADPMVIGDTVTLIDDLAAGGTIVSVEGLDTSVPAAGDEIPGSGEIELFDTVVVTPAETDDEGNETAPEVTAERGLAVGQSVTVVYDVVVEGDEPVTNTVTVADRNGEHDADAVVDPAAPSLSLVKSADTQRATTVGQKVTYSFVVKNTGNITLKEIVVTDGEFSGKGVLPAPSCPTDTLQPAASMTCTSVYTVVAADLTGKDLTNTATAAGKTPLGNPVVSEKSSAAIVTIVPLVNTGGQGQFALAGAALALLVLGGTGFVIARRRAAAAK